MDFQHSRWARRIGFGSFYLVQGLPWGYVSFALSARMVSQGRGAGELSAVMAASALPWTIKPLAGALVDAFGEHPLGGFRFYALAAQALMMPCLLALAAVEGTAALVADLLLIGLLCSFQDVAGDALAVRLVPPRERAQITGIMHATFFPGINPKTISRNHMVEGQDHSSPHPRSRGALAWSGRSRLWPTI